MSSDRDEKTVLSNYFSMGKDGSRRIIRISLGEVKGKRIKIFQQRRGNSGKLKMNGYLLAYKENKS